MEATMSLEDDIAWECHAIFNKLPLKYKPRELHFPKAEWTPLSAIAITRGDGSIRILSLGTGMKCMPAEAISGSGGIILHDWHAETVAIRAFNRFLVEESNQMASNSQQKSEILDWRKPQSTARQPFSIRDDVKIYMYCSEVPCGDASMELVMEAQEDHTPWPSSPIVDEDQSILLGRGSFDKIGIVRRKPSRVDSPATLSKSCSDKIALKQCTSLLSGLTSLLISPINAYINTLIIPEKQYRAEACERAFGQSGRLRPLVGQSWLGGYSFRLFDVKTTEVDFSYSRGIRKDLAQGNSKSSSKVILKGSNISAVWIIQSASSELAIPHSSSQGSLFLEKFPEALVNGRLQGWKEGDARGASNLSRKKMWEAVAKVLSLLCISLPEVASYTDLKLSNMLVERRIVKARVTKEALKGWTPNITDDFEVVSRSSNS